MVSRHDVASSSAALRKTAARSSNDQLAHSCPRGLCGVDRLLDVLLGRLVILAEHVGVVVRHYRLTAVARFYFFAADDERHIDFFARHRLELCFERRSLRPAGACTIELVR